MSTTDDQTLARWGTTETGCHARIVAMANAACVQCGHTEHGDSSYCMNPTCGALLPTTPRPPATRPVEHGVPLDALGDPVGGAEQSVPGVEPADATTQPVGKRSRPGQFVVAAALVTVAALAVTAIAILRDDGGAPREAPRPTSASLSPELVTQVLDQARPTGVEVRDEQTAVTVRWSRSSRSNDQHLVQVLAVDAGMQPRTEPVAGQRDEVRVEGS